VHAQESLVVVAQASNQQGKEVWPEDKMATLLLYHCSVNSSTQRIIEVNGVIAQIGRAVMYWNKF
jgi:hypothetical protein